MDKLENIINENTKKNTNIEGAEGDPFTRRDSITRTPPDSKKVLVSPFHLDTNDGREGKEETLQIQEVSAKQSLSRTGGEAKRKRAETPVKTRMKASERDEFLQRMTKEHGMLKEIISKTTNEIRTLRGLITEIPNTKKEIKNAIGKLDSCSKKMMTATKFIEEIIEEFTEATKDNEMRSEPTETEDIGTQTISKQQEERERIIIKIEDALDNKSNVNDLQEEMGLKWPEEVYKHCHLSKFEARAWENEDQIIIIKAGEEQDRTLREATERNPQLTALLREGKIEPGKMACSITTNGIIGEDDVIENSMDRYTYLIMTEGGGETLTDKVSLNADLQKAIEIARKNGRSKTVCTLTKSVNEICARKMLEYTFRKEKYQITMCSNKTKQESNMHSKTVNDGMIEAKTHRNRNDDTIILRPMAGITYAELIKNMKTEVDTQGIEVDRINRTSSGNVQIRIKGKDEKNKQMFRETLTKKMGSLTAVSVKRRRQRVMILDIDETTLEKDVQGVLSRELNGLEGMQDGLQLKLADKASKTGVKYAFVSLDENAAKHLVAKKTIGQGWHRWRVREVITPVKCYKCQKVGHVASKCGAKESEGACYNCGEMGHKKRECQNTQRCYLCKAEGHKAETMRCPDYRKMVQAMRMEQAGRAIK